MLRLRHPARHYIHYLISRRTLNVKGILENLSEMQIPLPQEKDQFLDLTRDILKLQKEMKIPSGFDPGAKLLAPGTVSFLDRWKVGGMWRKDEYVQHAIDVVFEPHIRRSIEVMLLGPLNAAAIAKRICSRWGLSDNVMNARVIKEYGHYFWHYGCMNIAEWKSFFYTHYPRADQSDFVMALYSPRTLGGAALTLAVSDRGADQLSDTEVYSVARNASFVNFMQHALMEKPGLSRTQGAFFALQTFKMAAEELDKTRGASAELLDELRNMETVYDRGSVATVADLPIHRDLPVLEATLHEEEKEKT